MKEQRVSLLEKTELFVLDMDGTFYLGEHILEGALEFLQTLKETGRRSTWLGSPQKETTR